MKPAVAFAVVCGGAAVVIVIKVCCDAFVLWLERRGRDGL
jgi:hypothetical protein